MAHVERSFASVPRDFAVERQIVTGIVGGLAGGVVFGMMMAMMGALPMIAALVGSQSAAVGFVVHMFISAGIGGGFGLVFGRVVASVRAGAGIGVLYGAVWWVLGPLTIMPILLGMGPQWSIAAAVGSLASLMGHMVYGAVAGAVYGVLTTRR